MKDQGLNKELAKLTRNEKPGKQAAIVKGIAGRVLGGDAKSRFVQFSQTVAWFKRSMLNRPEERLIGDALLSALFDRMDEEQNYRPILELHLELGKLFGDPGIIPLMYPEQLTRQEAPSYVWALNAFFTYIGANTDRATRFALYLMGCLSSFIRDMRSFTWEGLDASFEKIMQSGEGELLVAAQSVLQASVQCAPSPKLPMKRWFEQLLDACMTNMQVREVLDSILMLVNLQVIKNPWQYQTVFMEEAEAEATWKKIASYRGRANWSSPIIWLPERHRQPFAEFGAALKKARMESVERGAKVLERFVAKRSELVRAAHDRIADVMRNAHRGFRPNGQDHVEIQVAPLYTIGFRGLIFHPENRVLPNLGIELVRRGETPHLFTMEVELDIRESLQRYAETAARALGNNTYPVDQLSDLLFTVLADILHRVTIGDRPLRAKAKHESHEAEGREVDPTVGVRPYLNKLGAGHKASDESQRLCREVFGWSLPPGRTFVPAHYRNGTMDNPMPTAPRVIYRDDDLFAAV